MEFFKSIFSSSEKKRGARFDSGLDEEKPDFTPPMDDRRKLSISRSGRMRQANKKRHSLSNVYTDINQPVEKPTSLEYHVNPVIPASLEPKNQRSRSQDPKLTEVTTAKNQELILDNNKRKGDYESEIRTPEEEIETAFEIIDKVL